MSLDLDPGSAGQGNPQLIEVMASEMDGGAISFERFMTLALYHPEHGYYTKPGRVGTGGDFLTSPTIHPLFGWVVAGWCHDVWQRLGEPEEFTILEPGAGEGALARTILDWATGRGSAFARAIRYVAVERGARGTDPRVEWRETLPEPFAAGVVVMNEFFDALPVRVFEPSERGPVEVYVQWTGERFEERGGPVVRVDGAPDDCRFEVNPMLAPSAAALAECVGRGAMLVFDYGYEHEELWAPWRRQGTMLCFYRHTANDSPYDHVGEQDMTTHIDFTVLREALEGSGLEVSGPVTQADFLLACGAGGLVDAVRGDLQEYFARRRAMEQITDVTGLGRVRVMAGLRGLDGPLAGFEEAGA